MHPLLTILRAPDTFPRRVWRGQATGLFHRPNVDMTSDQVAGRVALAIGMACGLGQSGCATVAPGVEHTSGADNGYSGGRAQQDFPRNAKFTSAAAAEALDDLKMTSIKRSLDGTVYKIEGKTEDNRTVLVTVRRTRKRHASAAGSAGSATRFFRKRSWSALESDLSFYRRRRSPTNRRHRRIPIRFCCAINL